MKRRPIPKKVFYMNASIAKRAKLLAERGENNNADANRPADTPAESPSKPSGSRAEAAEMDTNDGSVAMDTNVNDFTSSSVGGGSRVQRSTNEGGSDVGNKSGEGLRGMASLPTGVRQSTQNVVRTYKKQYLLRIENDCIKAKNIIVRSTPTDNFYARAIRYPYHELPVNSLGFYLSMSEIQDLQTRTRATVKDCRIKCYNKTAVLTFETNASTTNIGNNNIGVYLNIIDPQIQSARAGEYEHGQGDLIERVCWGSDVNLENEWKTELQDLGAQYLRRNWDNSFLYYTPVKQHKNPELNITTDMTIPLFDINPWIEKRINVSFDEGNFLTWSYQPKNGLIAGQMFDMGYTAIGRRAFSKKYSLPLTTGAFEHSGSSGVNIHNYSDVQNGEGSSVCVNTIYVKKDSALATAPFLNCNPVQYSQMVIDDPLQGKECNVPPLIFGIEPLLTYQKMKWAVVPCFVDIYVDVECDVLIQNNVNYINPSMPSTCRPDYRNPLRIPVAYNQQGNQYQYSFNNNRQAFDNGIIESHVLDRVYPANEIDNYKFFNEEKTDKITTRKEVEPTLKRSITTKLADELTHLEDQVYTIVTRAGKTKTVAK